MPNLVAMFVRILIFLMGMAVLPLAAFADDRLVRLHVPDALIETGLVKFFAPRFSLKTQVRIELVDTPETAHLAFGDTGRPLFEGIGQVWHMDVRTKDHPGTDKLVSWLRSDIGKRTVLGFAPDGDALFTPPRNVQKTAVAVELDGDSEVGHEVSVVKCARCHAVDEKTRMSGIGSTPSFSVLRTLPDWEGRFAAFYILKPHPAFTQIEDVTDPFPENRPSPIAPIELTIEEVEAVLAYVAAMEAADLGGALQHQ